MPTITLHPSRVASEDSYYKSVDGSHPLETILGKGTSNGTYAQWYMINGSSAYTRVMYAFDVSAIPANATINKVTCAAKCQAQNASAARGGNTRTHLRTGETEIAASGTMAFGTSATVVTIEGSMTREQLDSVKMDVFAARGFLGTSTSYWIRCYGVDLTVDYTVPEPETPETPETGHQTLVNGTVYPLSGGRCRVSGTGYDITGGRTLIGGSGYDVPLGGTSRVWKLNAVIAEPAQDLTADFTYSDFMGNAISAEAIGVDYETSFAGNALQYFSASVGTSVYNFEESVWVSDTYRTLTFTDPPSGELLEWLSANAAAQG